MTAFDGSLEAVEPLYDLPTDDLVGQVLNPAMQSADEVSIASGYFSSHALAKVAPGLASALNAHARFRLLLSPELSEEDWDALRRGVRDPANVVKETVSRILNGDDITATALERHTAACLSYLIAANRIEIRFVLMPRGMYHKKQWLIRCGVDRLAVHGSGNTTVPGLFVNGEQMSIDRDWVDGERAHRRVSQLCEQFELDWEGRRPNAVTVSADAAVHLVLDHALRGEARSATGPTVSDFWAAWMRDFRSGLEPALPLGVKSVPVRLVIPAGVLWREGRYGHQGLAVDAFLANGNRGVLAIATGGGKTRTALIAASQLQDQRHAEPFLLVVLVPSDPLVRQWAEEVRSFDVQPTVLSDVTAALRGGRIAEVEAALIAGGPRTEVLVSTMQLFTGDERVRALVDRASKLCRTMLVADEAHNFGVPTFIDSPPEAFQIRLGLSATPIRQYDLAGTNALFDYLGPQVYEFSLAQAIESHCLVPYDYFIHRVTLTDAEMDTYRDLTEQLYRAGFRIDDDGRVVIANKTVERLLQRRRAVLEQAEGKIEALRNTLSGQQVQRSLIYCSPKKLEVAQERQIILVNRLLSELGIISHELTSKETSSGRASQILSRFTSGEYQALTAMKVLDEGVDVPATQAAFILASTTVEREWVQRRGRVLRAAPGKTSASVHDFVVLPPQMDDAGRSVLRGEVRRARAFAELARNQWDDGGPIDEIESLEQLVRER